MCTSSSSHTRQLADVHPYRCPKLGSFNYDNCVPFEFKFPAAEKWNALADDLSRHDSTHLQLGVTDLLSRVLRECSIEQVIQPLE